MSPRPLGLAAGIGLVVAEMVGIGILTTTGFMARDLSPGQIVACWLLGGLAALAGARAYAELANLVPRSGGEYQYLSTLVHPAAGYVAGWASLLVGFAAPAAASASAAGVFVQRLAPAVPAQAAAVAILLVVAGLHAAGERVSRRAQNVLSFAKAAALVVFVALGLLFGRTSWPAPAAPAGAFPVTRFAIGLVFVAYAMTGWNAAAYASEEFRDPRRDVARATVLGCAAVLAFYLLVNWIFVANLPGADMAAWAGGDKTGVTLAHLVAERIAGPRAAALVSALIVLSLVGSASAMVWTGPRVMAVMARDGFLPRRLSVPGRGQAEGVALQIALALLMCLSQSFEALITHVGVVLTLFSAATALSLLRVALYPRAGEARPQTVALVAAAVFGALSTWMLVHALRASPSSALVAAAVLAAGLGAYAVAARRRSHLRART